MSDIAAFVRRSTERQGIPERIADPAAIARVSRLLRVVPAQRPPAERVAA